MNFDIALLGSGISCTQTLLQLIDKMDHSGQPKERLQILVVEKFGEPWRGIPYGQRSSVNSLTITTLGEFVHPNEKEGFYGWLKQNRENWMAELMLKGGETAKSWYANNQAHFESGKWDEIYIPRFLYGKYLQEKLAAAIGEADRKGIATIDLIQGEAVDIELTDNDLYKITVRQEQPGLIDLSAKRLVLCIGSGTIKPVLPEGSSSSNDLLYVNDTYYPSLQENLNRIEELLDGIGDEQNRNMLILGSNASSLELVYLINQHPSLKNRLHQIVVLSYSGMFPHRITQDSVPNYSFDHLLALKEAGFDAHRLYQTIELDLDIAYGKGVHIGDMYYQLSDLVVELLKKLDHEQEKEFYSIYGNRFTKLIRRAGAEYRDAAQQLMDAGTLKLIKGSFGKIQTPSGQEKGYFLQYHSRADQPVQTYPAAFPIVVNCGGFEDLDESSSPLISNLVKRGLCTVNRTRRGFEVTEKFEAGKNLYVMGPLLGGIFNNKIKYWHVENAKRIHALSCLLADVIAESLN